MFIKDSITIETRLDKLEQKAQETEAQRFECFKSQFTKDEQRALIDGSANLELVKRVAPIMLFDLPIFEKKPGPIRKIPYSFEKNPEREEILTWLDAYFDEHGIPHG